MALIVKDRVREITSTTGTGTITLTAAVVGFQSFSVIGDGNTTYYTIVDAATGAFEVGIGTYTASGTTLSRDTVLESSNANALVNFSSGTKDVFVTYPADRSVSQADIGTAPNEIPLNQYLGSMAYQDLESVTIDGGVATLGTATISSIQNNTNISEAEPTLDLNFAKVKALDPRITFARASTGTYYDGKTYAKAEENLLTYSQEFDNAAWSKNGITVTANSTAAPDGTTTADTITPNTTNTFHRAGQSPTVPASNVTISVYAKSNGYDFLHLRLAFGASGVGLAFNLTNGVTSTGYREGNIPLPAPASFSVVDDGDGWYRCSITNTVTAGSATQYNYIGETATVVSFAGDGTSGVYLWGAQLEQRSAVSSYTPTTTKPITLYQPALQTAASGVARFDHDPVTQESLGLLIEEQRTNLALYSEQFDDGYWVKSGMLFDYNSAVAPDGTTTADKVILNSTSQNAFVYRNSLAIAGRVVSVFVKPAGHNFLGIKLGNSATMTVDLVNGVLGQIAGFASSDFLSAVDVGNGFRRVSFKFPSGMSTLNYLAFTSRSTEAYDNTAFDGYSGIFIWGAQVEEGAFPTSYIPTVASQVTRSADSASMIGTNFSSWYRQDEGSFVLKYVENGNNSSATGLTVNDGTTTNRISFFADGSGGTPVEPTFVVVSGNATQALIVGSAPAINTVAQSALGYKVNSFVSIMNGSVINSDVVGIVPLVTQMQIGNQLNSSFANRSIKRLTYFPQRLDNAELVEMTEQ